MENEKIPYFCSYACCEDSFIDSLKDESGYMSDALLQEYFKIYDRQEGLEKETKREKDYPRYAYSEIGFFEDKEAEKRFCKEFLDNAYTYPLVNKTGEHYTSQQHWAYWLGRMNTYVFENVSFRDRESGKLITKVFPKSKEGFFIVNAFTLAQARNILVSNIRHWGVKSVIAGPNPNIYDIKYKIGKSYLGYRDDIGSSDCGLIWGDLNYTDVVRRKLAFERGLIPEGWKDYFSAYQNAVERQIR